jgi:hypothetical protein
MEIRLKEGASLRCEITGTEEKALVKLQTDSGETPWMGIEALRKAYRILAPIAQEPQELEPIVQKKREPDIHLLTDPPQLQVQPAPQPQAKRQLSQSDIQNLSEFQNQLVDLINDPPPMNDRGGADGLSEAHIRGLIRDHQGRFQDPSALYPILQRHLGMAREE